MTTNIPNTEEILSVLKRSLSQEVEKIESSLRRLLESARQLMGLFQEMKRISDREQGHLLSLLNDYKQRVQAFLNYFREPRVENSTFRNVPDSLVVLLYDEMLMILLLAFSICDYSQKYMFDAVFRAFLRKHRLIKDKYDDLQLLGHICRGRRLFDPYNFPIILSMFLKSNDHLKETFANALNLTPEERDGEIEKFTESYVYLMGIRNQIAHMSIEKQLYSIEKISLNGQMLARYFSTFQSDLERLILLFRTLADELKTQGYLKKKK